MAEVQAIEVEFEVRECTTVDEFEQCIALQRAVFALPDIEISPRRHFIVSRRAGGWTLGAFAGNELVGFVHHVQSVVDDEITGYSHMMAVASTFQNRGVGAQLKWAQRRRALDEGRRLIRWTWDPMQARNAHFNINRLGVIVRSYGANFYGTDYSILAVSEDERQNLDSDRLFAIWELNSERVEAKASGRTSPNSGPVVRTIEIPPYWTRLVRDDIATARDEQQRVRGEFMEAFERGLVCSGFERDERHPRYLLFDDLN